MPPVGLEASMVQSLKGLAWQPYSYDSSAGMRRSRGRKNKLQLALALDMTGYNLYVRVYIYIYSKLIHIISTNYATLSQRSLGHLLGR